MDDRRHGDRTTAAGPPTEPGPVTVPALDADLDADLDAGEETAASGTGSSPRSMLALLGALALALAWAPLRPYAVTIVVLLGLVGLHEAGHFFVARWLRVGTPEFAVGFGPVLWSRHWRDTRYTLRAVPLGGFVRIDGMDAGGPEARAATGSATGSERPSSAPSRVTRPVGEVSPWGQMAIAAAGPIVNIFVAFVILVVLFGAVGVPTPTTAVTPVGRDAPAALAGMRAGDRIVALDGTPVRSWERMLSAAADLEPGRAVEVVAVRDGTRRTFTVTPDRVDGRPRLGVTAITSAERLGPAAALARGAAASRQLLSDSVRGLTSIGEAAVAMPAQLLGATPEKDAPRILSPVGAAKVGRDTASRSGLAGVLLLVAAVSMFLAVFNLLPIPPFDGGHIVLAGYEALASAVARRPVVVDRTKVVPVAVTVTVAIGLMGALAIALDVLRPVVLP